MADQKGKNNEIRKIEAKKRQLAFLDAYGEYATIRGACSSSGISRSTYDNWHANDMEFVRSFDAAKQAFAEYLESLAFERVRNPDKGRGSDVLLIALLNSNMPWKYKPQIAGDVDSAKELIMEWRKAAKEVKKSEAGTLVDLDADIDKTLEAILLKDIKKEDKDAES